MGVFFYGENKNMSDIKDWSLNAENNNKPSPNGFPEHMPPSGVNNSEREVMRAVRKSYLEQPYFNPGGVINRVDGNTFSIEDTSEITDFSQFYTTGRRLKFISVDGVQYGNVGAVSYSGSSTEVRCYIDGEQVINNFVSDVLCGLDPMDTAEIVGRLPVGMILQYTADIVPPGFLLADGKSFDPDIYTQLAAKYKIGEDEYLYGQELVGGKYWVKTPDVRGYFPRYLDMGAEIDTDKERKIGSVQDYAINNIDFAMNGIASVGTPTITGSAKLDSTAGGQFGGSGNRGNRNNLSMKVSEIIPSDKEVRPKNMAFPALIVAWHGVIPAENITIQDLLTAFNQMQGSINEIYDAKTEALTEIETTKNSALVELGDFSEEVVETSKTEIENAKNEAVETVTTTKDEAINTVNSTTEEAVTTVTSTKNEAIEEVQGVSEEIKAEGDVQIEKIGTYTSEKLLEIDGRANEEVENAKKWASNPENVVVKDGLFSAFHYMKKTKEAEENVISITDDVFANKISNVVSSKDNSNIKIEIASDKRTFTVLQGSKLYNIFGDELVLSSDVASGNISGSGYFPLIYTQSTNTVSIIGYDMNIADTQPPLTTRGYWFDFENKKTYYNATGVSWEEVENFYLLAANRKSGSFWETIVPFSSSGWLRRMMFVMPGLKVIIPNGYNNDGTLKTIKYKLENLSYISVPKFDSSSDPFSYLWTLPRYLFIDNNGKLYLTDLVENGYTISDIQPALADNIFWFNPRENILYRCNTVAEGWSPFLGCLIGNRIIPNKDDSSFVDNYTFFQIDNPYGIERTPLTANTLLNNLTKDGKATISFLSKPNNKKQFENVTLGSTSSLYTAPASGVLIIKKKPTAAGQYINFYNITSGFEDEVVALNATREVILSIPMSKGDRVTYTYTVAGAASYFRFHYDNGSVVSEVDKS